MAAILVLALFSQLETPPTDRQPVRAPTEPRIQALIAAGAERSPTFRSLLERLNASDVIVYVVSQVTREGLGGYLVHRVSNRGAYRYLTLVVSVSAADERLIGVLAHELQHAVEIAAAPDVGRTESVDALFERIGFRMGCPRGCYETIEAMNVERRVRDELRATP